MTLSDLAKIFKYTKHRAVPATAELLAHIVLTELMISVI